MQQLEHAVLSGVAHEGLSVHTIDGRRARLAIVDDDGKVIEAGPGVEREAWRVAVESYRNFLRGQGHLRVQSVPPGRVA